MPTDPEDAVPTTDPAAGDAGCVFCRIVAREQEAHEVWRSEQVVAFLDRAPLFEGHVLVVPSAHHETLADLPPGELAGYFSVVRRVSAALPPALGCSGSFVAVNNVVSQSVPHLLAHVVPRSRGDGLRGFFWPRRRYADDGAAAADARRLAAALGPA